MSAAEVLALVESQGGTIRLDGADLRVRAPEPLPAQTMQLIREHKPRIVQLLRQHDREESGGPAWCPRRERCGPEVARWFCEAWCAEHPHRPTVEAPLDRNATVGSGPEPGKPDSWPAWRMEVLCLWPADYVVGWRELSDSYQRNCWAKPIADFLSYADLVVDARRFAREGVGRPEERH